jgi:hypothetical protein
VSSGLSQEQVFLDVSKSEPKNAICRGVYHKEKTRIPCDKKANYVCRVTKEDVEQSASSEAANMAKFFDLSVNISIKINVKN